MAKRDLHDDISDEAPFSAHWAHAHRKLCLDPLVKAKLILPNGGTRSHRTVGMDPFLQRVELDWTWARFTEEYVVRLGIQVGAQLRFFYNTPKHPINGNTLVSTLVRDRSAFVRERRPRVGRRQRGTPPASDPDEGPRPRSRGDVITIRGEPYRS